MASVTAPPGISPYVAAKHALLGLCESLGHDLAAVNAPVGVTLLLPGKVATGMSQSDYPDAITADEAARIAFDAVEQGRPLAFTHADRVPEVERRFAAIVADGRPPLSPAAWDPAIRSSQSPSRARPGGVREAVVALAGGLVDEGETTPVPAG